MYINFIELYQKDKLKLFPPRVPPPKTKPKLVSRSEKTSNPAEARRFGPTRVEILAPEIKNISPAINIGAGAVPHSLHNGNMSGANGSFNAAYANPPTSVDANDGTAQCRTTASAPGSPGGGWYVIAGSFGQPVTQCMDGFYIEVHYRDENIRIDDLRCKVFFAAGSPTSEPTNASEPNWPQ